MTIRRSDKTNRSRATRRRNRLAKMRKDSQRFLQLENLEDRRLMAAQLAGIQVNDGKLVNDGDTLTVSPQELTFQFSEDANIDETSLDAIQITRSGLDGEFTAASVTTDFNTNGLAVVRFSAQQIGQGGNALQIFVTKTDHGDASGPTLSVSEQQISIDLNTNFANGTTAEELIDAVNNDPEVGLLVRAEFVRGNIVTNLAAADINYSPLQLTGANAASVTTDFDTGFPLDVTFTAVNAGIAGNGVTLDFTKSDHGGPGLPIISVEENTIHIALNTNLGNETTATELVETLKIHPAASQLVEASIPVGTGETIITATPLAFSPLILVGANDVIVEAGAKFLEPNGREVVFRFAERLPDDVYRVNVLGSGPAPLMDLDGEAFNEGEDAGLGFELNLGPEIVSVVPQPVRRDAATGQLTQRRNQIAVYFNDDDLFVGNDASDEDQDGDTDEMSPSSAEHPSFYQLFFTGGTTQNVDDVVFHPSLVEYDPELDLAILTFASDLDELV
ncbi:MAG: hypothetical protein MK165_10585, partial [Pirellulaceae bacterium]|nr:hypothetical protein [Pirellulaceae bacterium]